MMRGTTGHHSFVSLPKTERHVETTIRKIELTKAQVDRLDAGGLVAIPASWDEFLDVLPESPYRIEYHSHHIMVTGLASFVHEVLIGNIIALLKAALKGTSFYVAGSNVGVLKAEGTGYYNPDITVVNGQPQFRPGSNAIITNPYLVVEVLKESTAAYDLHHKLPKYEQIESLQEAVFVDRFEQSVSTFRRTESPNVWTQTNYYQLTDVARIDQYDLHLSDIFANLPDEAA